MTPQEYASTGLHLFYLDDIKAGEVMTLRQAGWC